MNLCFIMGKIVSEVKFDFVIGNKCLEKEKISVARFSVDVFGEKINVICYNKIADFCYQKLVVGNFVFIKGFLKTNGNVEMEGIELINRN